MADTKIRLKYYFKENPSRALSIYLKDQTEVEAFKRKHPDVVYLETTK
tara:strand:- start:4299 stop:4442 length:144 start_codon:yes stop_codon:yes gene_type:complete